MNLIESSIKEHLDLIKGLDQSFIDLIYKAADLIKTQISKGNKAIFFGNGGSAADAQHIAAEFTGRFVKERSGLAAVALTTDTSALTAIGNDYGFDEIFRRQLEAIGQKGDVVIGISTSGYSENVLKAIQYARENDFFDISLLGKSGGSIGGISSLPIIVPSETTARIQEVHILVGHLICEVIDQHF